METENKSFTNDLKKSKFYTCPISFRVLALCEVKYTTDGNNFYILTDGMTFQFTNNDIMALRFYLNNNFTVNYSGSSFPILEVTEDIYQQSGVLYYTSTSYITSSDSNLQFLADYIEYNLSPNSPISHGSHRINKVKLLSYTEGNELILTKGNGFGILEGKEITYKRVY